MGMLALGREIGDEVQIVLPDGRVGRVVLLGVWNCYGEQTKCRARIGFDFPRDIKIKRSELDGIDGKDQPSGIPEQVAPGDARTI